MVVNCARSNGKCIFVGKKVADIVILESLFESLDTEGGFSAERLEIMDKLMEGDGKKVLESTFVVRITCLDDLVQVLCKDIESIILKDKRSADQPFKLLVIDSIAFHFRYGIENMAYRSRLLTFLGQKLCTIAHSHDIAILVTNHGIVTTNPLDMTDSKLIPSLGLAWGKMPHSRIFFFFKDSQRYAHSIQRETGLKEDGVIAFHISEKGLYSDENTEIFVTDNDQSAMKRQRI
jgi:hypothetical protein